nr:hypothetical protein [Tanacetum cinerariifolium]
INVPLTVSYTLTDPLISLTDINTLQTLQQGQLINSALAVAKYTSNGNSAVGTCLYQQWKNALAVGMA